MAAPQTQTSLTWTSNLSAGKTYEFNVYAIDAAGNEVLARAQATGQMSRIAAQIFLRKAKGR